MDLPPVRRRPPLPAAPGQAMVEFALTMPIFLLWLFVTIQLSLMAVQSYSVVQVTRESARWLATRPDTTDTAVRDHIRANALSLDPNRFYTLDPLPACPSLSGGRCPGRSPGSVITLVIHYDARNLIFLPTTYGYSGVSVTLPSDLPPYRVSVMVE